MGQNSRQVSANRCEPLERDTCQDHVTVMAGREYRRNTDVDLQPNEQWDFGEYSGTYQQQGQSSQEIQDQRHVYHQSRRHINDYHKGQQQYHDQYHDNHQNKTKHHHKHSSSAEAQHQNDICSQDPSQLQLQQQQQQQQQQQHHNDNLSHRLASQSFQTSASNLFGNMTSSRLCQTPASGSHNDNHRVSRLSHGSSIFSQAASRDGGTTISSVFTLPADMPETAEQLHTLCERIRAKGDVKTQLDFCRRLMIWASRSISDGHNHFGGRTSPAMNLGLKKRSVGEMSVIEARRLLKRLASTGPALGYPGDSEAQLLLADCYGVGALGLSVSHERAFRWYIQASKQNHAEATYRAGVCHELGIGTSVDGSRAVAFYRKAASMAHVGGMYKLGMILLRGYCHQIPMRREALSWLQRAAAVTMSSTERPDVPHALHALAMIHLTGEVENESTNLISDPEYALQLLREAAQRGFRPSQLKLGGLYEHGQFLNIDDAQSLLWYTRACSPHPKDDHHHNAQSLNRRGSVQGALALSAWYLTGSAGLLPQSDQEARSWACKAVKFATRPNYADHSIHDVDDDNEDRHHLMAKAYYILGIYTEQGIGLLAPAPEKSEKWFHAAAALGHDAARQRLKQLRELTSSSKTDVTKGSDPSIDQTSKTVTSSSR